MRIDRMCERLRAALPDDVRLIITGDHGMVDVPHQHQVIAEDHPTLMAGIPRLRGRAASARFTSILTIRGGLRLGGKTSSAIAPGCGPGTRLSHEGWFGPVDDALRERYGHVLVALRDRPRGDDPAVPPRTDPHRDAWLIDSSRDVRPALLRLTLHAWSEVRLPPPRHDMARAELDPVIMDCCWRTCCFSSSSSSE